MKCCSRKRFINHAIYGAAVDESPQILDISSKVIELPPPIQVGVFCFPAIALTEHEYCFR